MFHLNIKGDVFVKVKEFKYLGSIITAENCIETAINAIINIKCSHN